MAGVNYFDQRKVYTSHEVAGFIIARRGIGFSDYLNADVCKRFEAPRELVEIPSSAKASNAKRRSGTKEFRSKVGLLWSQISKHRDAFKYMQGFFSSYGNSWHERLKYLDSEYVPRGHFFTRSLSLEGS